MMHALLLALALGTADMQSAAAAPSQTTPAATPVAAAPQPQTPPAATPAPPAAPQAPPPPPETYVYQSSGRRDPFLSPFGGSSESRQTSRRGDGPAGMALAEISVRGILQSRGTLVAMVQGPDNRTYIVHQGDKLLDGTIKSVIAQGLIVIQEVNDPLSLVKQREVRKLLRTLEDSKE
jgi:Tfp pilus assembly protein PilP